MIKADEAGAHDRPAPKGCYCVKRSVVDRVNRLEPTQKGWLDGVESSVSRRHKPGAVKHSGGTETSTNAE